MMAADGSFFFFKGKLHICLGIFLLSFFQKKPTITTWINCFLSRHFFCWFCNYLKGTEIKWVLWRTYATASPTYRAKRTINTFLYDPHFRRPRTYNSLSILVGGIIGAELNRKNQPRCLMKTCTNDTGNLWFQPFSKKRKKKKKS